ncbi:reverse transcriptase domain-containing protein [Tanacetum coccineum]
MIDIYNVSHKDYLKDLFTNEKITNHQSGNPTFSSHTNLTSPEVINPLSGDPTPILEPMTKSSSSPTLTSLEESELIWEEFEAYLASDSFPSRNDDHKFNNDPTKEMDFILEDSVDEGNLANPNNDLVDAIPEMFTDEHTLDYSSPPLYDDVDDNLVELKSDNDDVYDDPFDYKEDKIKESKLLIDELDPPRSSDFLPSPKYDSVFYEDFSKVDALPSTNNEDKVFNPGILIHENLFEITIRVTNCAKNVKKTTNASLILEDFNPPLYELPFHKEVPGSETLLSFSSENEEKVFNPGILTSKGVHTSLLLELSHRGPKAFKVIKIFESPMEIFPCSYREDIRVLDVPCEQGSNPGPHQPQPKLYTHHTTPPATCGARNIDFVKTLGADEVLDYKTSQGATLASPSDKKYDVVIHCATPIPWSTFDPNLSPKGKVIDVTPGLSAFWTAVVKKVTCSKKQLVPILLIPKAKNLDYMVGLVKEGKLKTTIDSKHPLNKAEEAWAKSIDGHATGKIIVEP